MGYFIYENSVSGNKFIGRKQEVAVLTNLLSTGENVCIYEPPKTGRHSLLNQAFCNMKVTARQFSVVDLSLLTIRSLSDFALRLGSEILKSFCKTPLEFEQAVGAYLPGTHFVFDGRVFEEKGLALSLNWDLDDNDLRSVLMLPYSLASDRYSRLYVVLDEFQNIMLTEDGDKVCKLMVGIFKELDPDIRSLVAFVFMGSAVNAMKDIFAVRKLFYRTVERVEIEPVDEWVATDYFDRGFTTAGKVVDKELLQKAFVLFRGNLWYLNFFFFVCDSLSRGYITETVMTEALNDVIAVHMPRFIATMNDLTTFQVNMLRSVLDGNTRFSNADVIRRYGLNSAANVHRLKEALCRKEIITFNSDDDPVILDPLFEYWLRRFYFEN